MSLPRDVREYLEAMNGMPEEATTQDGLTRFWPIGRVLNNPDATVGSDQMGNFATSLSPTVTWSRGFFDSECAAD